MLTYQELLEQALHLSDIERLALAEALQRTVNNGEPLTSLQRLAIGALGAPRSGVPDDTSERADEVLREIIPQHLNNRDE